MAARPARHRARALTTACAVALAAAAALLPGAASAASLSREGGTLVYTASPGTRAGVGVQRGTQDDADTVLYTSGDDMTTTAAGCTPDAMYGGAVVECSGVTAVRIDLGDGDDNGRISDDVTVPVTFLGGDGADQLSGNPAANTLDGGPGDDALNGALGDDVLLGGDGNDDLQGKGGSDRLDGGAGNDVLHPDGFEAPAADVVDGGPGFDTVDADYASRFSADRPLLAFTLSGGADDGRPGEGDDLHGIERLELSTGAKVTGTEGPDAVKLRQVGAASELVGLGGDDDLRAGDGPDHLDGGPGADVLDGGFGDDTIVGGPGRDAISADLAGGDCGPLWCKLPYGNDVVQARDGEIDSITCGAGSDRVVADPDDVIASDCETVDRAAGAPQPTGGGAGGVPTPRARLSVASIRLGAALRGGLRVRLSHMPAGRVSVKARVAGAVVATGRAAIGVSGAARVRLRFTHAARKALAKRRSIRLTVRAGAVSRVVTVTR